MRNTTKRILALLLSGVLTTAVLTACGDKEENQPEKIPEEVSKWHADVETHWYGTKNGEKTELAEHTFEDGDFICTVCNFEIYDYEDGSCEVTEYDEKDNPIYIAYYDGGELMSTDRYEYTYNETGDVIAEKTYLDDTLRHEASYVLDSEGYPVLAQSVYYDEGSKCVTDYNVYGDITKDAEYRADGTVIYCVTYENKYDDNGNMIYHKAYNGDKLIEDYEYDYDEFGTPYAKKMSYFQGDGYCQVIEVDEEDRVLSDIFYNADGNVEEELLYFYEFDEEENPIYEKRTVNGVIDYEIETFYNDGEYAGEKNTTYNADGTYTVTTYNDDREVISEITYDTEGNVITESHE